MPNNDAVALAATDNSLAVGTVPASPEQPAPDLAAARTAVADLLTALGVDLDAPHVRDTPRRVAEAYRELLNPEPFNATSFPNEEAYDEMIVLKDIPFHSLCSHHLLPFYGHAHVAYLPGERLIGLSKLARVVEFYSRSLQVQERLTIEIADWLEGELGARGVAVVMEAEHLCMSMRGAKAPGTITTTSALRGLFKDDQRTREEFLGFIRDRN